MARAYRIWRVVVLRVEQADADVRFVHWHESLHEGVEAAEQGDADNWQHDELDSFKEKNPFSELAHLHFVVCLIELRLLLR